MDESLARGFTKQFFNWHSDDYMKVVDQDLSSMQSLSADTEVPRRNGFAKNRLNNFFEFRRKLLANFTINTLISGSSSYPFFLNTTFRLTEIDFKGYQEKAFIPLVTLIDTNDIKINPDLVTRTKTFIEEYAFYIISEHTIQRIFQRSDLVGEKTRFNPYLIIKEMKFVPIWTSFWILIKVHLQRNSNFEVIEPIIPSPNGMFLCEFENHKSPQGFKRLHLNTYIGLHQMSDHQKKLRTHLMEISENLENSVMSFYCSGDVSRDLKNQFILDQLIMLQRSLKFIDEIENEITGNNPIGINELIVKHLEKNKKFKELFSSLDQKLKNKSYSDFYHYMKSFMSKTPDGIELLISSKFLL